MHILITRPQPDASVWRAQLEARGVQVSIDPLLSIEMMPLQTLDLDGVQALIVTSRNGLRGLARSPALPKAVALPLYAVGPGTADLARELGFRHITEGPASARDLVPIMKAQTDPVRGRLLHLTGDKVAFDLATALQPAGFVIERVVVYRSLPAQALQPKTLKAITAGTLDGVALTSPLAAQTFVSLCQRSLNLEHYQRLVYVCLSQNIADAVRPLNPRAIEVAAQPNTDAMFTVVKALADTWVSHRL